VKRYRNDACYQIAVLDDFERLGWPACILNPLPRAAGAHGKNRRHNTVRSLNEGLAAGTIRFYAGGSGGGFRWATVA
jgi:hypothetical protein